MTEMLGTNQSGVRQHNERLVLSLLRHRGPLAKAEIARATGLSAQTVSVIMRALEEDGMILRGQPQRGRVGQPSVPMRLAPGGAYFFGLMVGRRSFDLLLVDMLGRVRARRQSVQELPDFDAALTFASEGVAEILSELSPQERARTKSIGIALPGRLWEWSEAIGVSDASLSAWRDRNFEAELARRTGLATAIQNDATAACGAELVFGRTEASVGSMIHIYVGYFIGGGLVLDGRLYTGPSGNAAAIGTMPVPQPDGSYRQLLEVASLLNLAERLAAVGKSDERSWTVPLDWSELEPEVTEWVDEVAPIIAYAIQHVSAVIDIDLAMLDGFMPERVRTHLFTKVEGHLDALDFRGVTRPVVLEGTLGADARALGAAALPLAQRYLV